MRVLHFVIGRCSLDSPHGVDQAIYQLARAQAAEGAEIAAFCLSPKSVIPIPGVEVRNFPGRPNPFRLPAALRTAIDEWRPDFVHLHGVYIPPNLAMARFARRRRIPYAITAHGNLSPRLLRRRPWLKVPYKILFERPLFNRAAFVHAIADEADIRAFGVHRPIVTAPNGFDMADIPPPEACGDIFEDFPDLRDKRFLLFLGRLDIEQKGLDVLLEAFALTTSKHPDLHLALAGPDWKGSRTGLGRQAESLGIADRVHFCGTVTGPKKFALIRACHAFVHPSRWEAGVPLAVLEALAVGKPCVLSKAADPQGQVMLAGAGVLAPTDARALALVIGKTDTASRDRGEHMSQAEVNLVVRSFTWVQPAETLLDECAQRLGPRRK